MGCPTQNAFHNGNHSLDALIELLLQAHWFTSSCSASNGNCVEVAFAGGGLVAVRDSKDRSGPAFVFSGADWDKFTTGLIAGVFDLP